MIILYFTLLYCTVLYCTVLYFLVLYFTLLTFSLFFKATRSKLNDMLETEERSISDAARRTLRNHGMYSRTYVCMRTCTVRAYVQYTCN